MNTKHIKKTVSILMQTGNNNHLHLGPNMHNNLKHSKSQEHVNFHKDDEEIVADLEREVENSHDKQLTNGNSNRNRTTDENLTRKAQVKKSTSAINIPSVMDLESHSEEDLWSVWNILLQHWDTVIAKRRVYQSSLESLVRRGIPYHLRPVVWKHLVRIDTKILTESYPQLIETYTSFEKQILRDSTRTFPEHDMFKGQDSPGLERLRNVIHAYAVYDPEVGYCQGLGFVAGLLLMTMPEEEAFCALVQILQENNIRDMYKPSMSLLSICLYQLDRMIEEDHTHLFLHLKHYGFTCSLYASSWFLTVFSTCLPLDTVFRIMDIYLLEGLVIIFQVSLALIELSESDLLDLDMEGIQQFFTTKLGEMYGNDAERLVKKASKIEIDKRKLKKWEKEFIRKKEKELQERKEIISLKNENRNLLDKVALLEKENGDVASQLIEKQMLRAKEAEDIAILKKELSRSLRNSSSSSDSFLVSDCAAETFTRNAMQELVQELAYFKVSLADKANKIEKLFLELRNVKLENTKLRSALLDSYQEINRLRKLGNIYSVGSHLSLPSLDDSDSVPYDKQDTDDIKITESLKLMLSDYNSSKQQLKPPNEDTQSIHSSHSSLCVVDEVESNHSIRVQDSNASDMTMVSHGSFEDLSHRNNL